MHRVDGTRLRYIVASDDELFAGGQAILYRGFLTDQQTLARALRPHRALGQKLLKPMDVVITVDEIGVAHEGAEQRQRGLDAIDHELVDRPPQPHQAFATRLAMHDELAEQRIVIRRDHIALIGSRIDPHAHAAGRMVMHDLARGGAERHWILSIDAAFDRVTVELHVALCNRQLIAVGDADLLQNEIDVGDHLGHGMLNLNAGVHLDEIEAAVLVQEFDRADAKIVQIPHGLRDGLPDQIALFRIKRGGGAFLQNFLVAALQRAVALAEMNGAAAAVAEHLDFNVARRFEILLKIDRIVAECRLRFGAGGRERSRKIGLAASDLHAAPAAAGRGLHQHREADLAGGGKRLRLGRDAALRSRYDWNAE